MAETRDFGCTHSGAGNENIGEGSPTTLEAKQETTCHASSIARNG